MLGDAQLAGTSEMQSHGPSASTSAGRSSAEGAVYDDALLAPRCEISEANVETEHDLVCEQRGPFTGEMESNQHTFSEEGILQHHSCQAQQLLMNNSKRIKQCQAGMDLRKEQKIKQSKSS